MNDREKLIKIMEAKQLSAKQFAEHVGIQAGTISNIMSGRNNPSWDVICKMFVKFPDINPDWFITGTGNMLRSSNKLVEPTLFDQHEVDNSQTQHKTSVDLPLDSNSQVVAANSRTAEPASAAVASDVVPNNRTLSKIIIFYNDGTYEER